MHWAAKHGRGKVVEYLLEEYGSKDGVWINQKNSAGSTALHLAVKGGSEKIVKSLLQAGAKSKLENHRKKTPQDMAKNKEHTETVKLLSEYENGSPLNPITLDNIDPETDDQDDTWVAYAF